MSAGPQPDPAELEAGRRRVEALVRDLPGAGDQPFTQPWELRAFAMAVAAYEDGQYEWSEFQQSLAGSIGSWERESRGQPWSYYEHWLTALEAVLAQKGALPEAAALEERTQTVLATPRNANHHRAHREPVAVSPARARF
jgi:nitrile hydratase accessory protein